MVALRPLGQHQQDRSLLGEVQQPFDQLDRGRVPPMEVLQRHHQRAVGGQAFDHVPDDLERPVLQRLRGQLDQAGGGVGLQRDAEHRPQVRVRLGGPVAEQLLDPPAQRDPHAKLRFGHRHAQPVADQVPERPVRQGLAVGDAPALDPRRRAVRG